MVCLNRISQKNESQLSKIFLNHAHHLRLLVLRKAELKSNLTGMTRSLKTINALGFVAETEEDTVQLFFYASSMRPTELSEEIQDLSAPEVQLTRDTVRVVQ